MQTKKPPNRRRSVSNQQSPLGRLVEHVLVLLSFVWIALIAFEFVYGERHELDVAVYSIWVIFILEFAIRFSRAQVKLEFLKRNWLSALSLLLPAFRVLRLIRLMRFGAFLRLVRGARLVKVAGSFNRAMRSTATLLSRRGLPFVGLLSLIVLLLGASAMFAFERPPGGTMRSIWDAIWFTAMIMTTMGSEYWPRSGEGRLLCIGLSVYAFAVFGYFTATLASFFVGHDQSESTASQRQVQQELNEIRQSLARLESRLSSNSIEGRDDAE